MQERAGKMPALHRSFNLRVPFCSRYSTEIAQVTWLIALSPGSHGYIEQHANNGPHSECIGRMTQFAILAAPQDGWLLVHSK